MPENFPEHLLKVVEGKTFEKQTIVLDGYTYSRCVFLRCQIVYSGGIFHTHECKFSPGCTMELLDAAGRTGSLIQGLCDTIPSLRSQLFPNWQSWRPENPGTSTIQ
jgi:hypothetical protein